MTEKQGGSDVLSNTTHAERLADDSYRLVGHKWFFSVPQSDAHLVLAQAKEDYPVSLCRVSCQTGNGTLFVLSA